MCSIELRDDVGNGHWHPRPDRLGNTFHPEPLDRIRELDELPSDAEALADPGRQCLNAEPLGGVMPGGQEVDTKLTGGVEARLLGLAGEEEVVTFSGRPEQARAAATGDNRDRSRCP